MVVRGMDGNLLHAFTTPNGWQFLVPILPEG
jgi:hypothetical protein